MKPAIKLFLLIAVLLASVPLCTEAAPVPPSNQLANGVGVVLSGAADSRQFFTIDATTQIYNLVVTLAGSNVDNGDTDLYIRFGEQPVPYNAQSPWGGVFNFVSEATGHNESITIATPVIGTHHVLVHGWYTTGDFTNVTLRATWSTTPPTGPIEGTVALSSITRHGVTWKFDRDYTTGQYANGDFWVRGPVVITQITPTPSAGRNGTVVNPVRSRYQGFDDRIYSSFYDDSQNVGTSMPLAVAVNSSVVSSISKPAKTEYSSIETFAVLTVVDAVQESGSFRPCYIGSGSRTSLFNANQIDYTKLQKLAPPSSTPSISTVAGYFDRVWYEQDLTWTGWYLHTAYMSPNAYGKGMAIRTGDAALLLNLNYTDAQKRDLLIRFIQYGIDIYGILVNGGSWNADGGHNNGRLSPLLTAAAVLNDSRLKDRVLGSGMKFQEFQVTFFVSDADINLVGRTGVNNDPIYNYTLANKGMPEWGIRHFEDAKKDNNFWGAKYRDISGGQLTAPAMAARVMGLRTMVNWEPLFQYAERHLNYEQSAGYGGEFNSNPTPAFHRQFYNDHKNAVPGAAEDPIILPSRDFAPGDRIAVPKDTNVWGSGTLTSTLLGVQVADSNGTIIGEPVGPDSNNITWWQVDFDTGVDGWTNQENISSRPVEPTGMKLELVSQSDS